MTNLGVGVVVDGGGGGAVSSTAIACGASIIATAVLAPTIGRDRPFTIAQFTLDPRRTGISVPANDRHTADPAGQKPADLEQADLEQPVLEQDGPQETSAAVVHPV